MSPSSSHASEPSAGLPTPKRAAPAAFRFAALFLSLLPLDAVTLEEARAGAKLDLEDAQRRLSQLRARIEEEKLPILREVNRLEHNATQKRKKYDDLLRSRDNRDASLLELREDVEEAEAELAADLGLLRDYARSWRNALPAPAKAALADELAAALIVPPEHESPMEAALAARLRVARLSLSHLRDACGGMRLEGEAIVPPEGERKQGAFLLLGRDAKPTADNLRKIGVQEEKAEQLAEAVEQNERQQKRVQNDNALLTGFGNNGGEEFLSYLMTSESLVITGGDSWKNWDEKMHRRLRKIQSGNGSWTGHHCITSPVFCTAAVIQCLNTYRDADMLRNAALATSAKKKDGDQVAKKK